MSESALKVAETRSGQVYIVAVSGRIDSTNANDLLARLNSLLSVARFVLCSVLGQVRELFEMGGLLDAFTILGSREEAVAQLG